MGLLCECGAGPCLSGRLRWMGNLGLGIFGICGITALTGPGICGILFLGFSFGISCVVVSFLCSLHGVQE